MAKLCDLNNPYETKEILANAKWSKAYKRTFAQTLNGYYKFIGKEWQRPTCKPENKLPYIPTEEEINEVIAASHTKYAAMINLLKDTGMRTDELLKLKWIDLDIARHTINITATKSSNGRILPISNNTEQLLKIIQPTTEKIFPTTKKAFRNTFSAATERAAQKVGNPRIKAIHPHTLRHWKGTTEYHKTKDIMHVRYVLGHKTIATTMIYINLEAALWLNQSDEWTCKTAKTIEEATSLIESGFDYITEIDGIKLFRKRK